jgi:hypothetical protein
MICREPSLQPEHQRFYCDGHCAGRLKGLAEINKIEVMESDPVDGKHVVLEFEVVF